MSNRNLREGPKPEAPAQAVTLHDALFMLLTLCRSVHARWDILTLPADLLPQNPNLKAPILEAAENFLTSLTAFDYCTTVLFCGMVSKPVDLADPRSDTEVGLYRRWREQFRTWRSNIELFIKALQSDAALQFRTLHDPLWPPASQRPEAALAVQKDLGIRLMMLRDSLAGLDKLLMQKAPSLLLEIAPAKA